MEPGEVAKVQARASQLLLKIGDAIAGDLSHAMKEEGEEEEEDREKREGKGGLRAIQEALQVLQSQLQSLQDLQVGQKLERDLVLVELEESRKVLIRELRGYDGTELEVLEEARAFVGEKVRYKANDDVDDLDLPPYSSSSPIGKDAFSVKRKPLLGGPRNRSLSSFPWPNSANQNTGTASAKEEGNNNAKEVVAAAANHPSKGGAVTNLVGFAAKAFLVSSSVAAILLLSHFEPKLRRMAAARKSLPEEAMPRRQPPMEEATPPKAEPPEPRMRQKVCPPGKVLLIQDGVEKCFVKERVEVPFKHGIQEPNVYYGCG